MVLIVTPPQPTGGLRLHAGLALSRGRDRQPKPKAKEMHAARPLARSNTTSSRVHHELTAGHGVRVIERGSMGIAHLALGADAVGAVNPHILGDTRPLLVELEVLLEL